MKRFSHEGILQIATGERYRDEAVSAVARIRPFVNGRPITLVTDKPELVPKGLFDTVILHPQPKKNSKHREELGKLGGENTVKQPRGL